MSGIFDFGGVPYDVDDLKIAARVGDGTYGTLIDVPSINQFRVEWQVKAVTATGDGQETAQASAIVSANISFRNFGIKRSMWTAMFPADNYSSGSTPNQIDDFYVEAGRPFPYFGAIARIFDGESATSGGLFFFPRIKIMSNLQWQAEYNTFVQPEMSGKALPDTVLSAPSGRLKFCHVKFYESNLPQITVMPLVAS